MHRHACVTEEAELLHTFLNFLILAPIPAAVVDLEKNFSKTSMEISGKSGPTGIEFLAYGPPIKSALRKSMNTSYGYMLLVFFSFRPCITNIC